MANNVDHRDLLVADLNQYVAPRFPCSKCGKETSEHEPIFEPTGEEENGQEKLRRINRRICSSAICRYVVCTES